MLLRTSRPNNIFDAIVEFTLFFFAIIIVICETVGRISYSAGPLALGMSAAAMFLYFLCRCTPRETAPKWLPSVSWRQLPRDVLSDPIWLALLVLSGIWIVLAADA